MKEGKYLVLCIEEFNKLNLGYESMRIWVSWRGIKVEIFIKYLELKVCILGEICVILFLRKLDF